MSVQKFWRVRLGAAIGHNGNEKLYDLCINEKPPCVAIGWGEIDLGESLDDIKRQYEKEYGEPLVGHELGNIRKWINIKKGDSIIVMKPPGILCAIGKVESKKRYRKEDRNFCIELKGYDDPHIARLFNRVDVKWLTNLNKNVKVNDSGLSEKLKRKLITPTLILEINKDEYNKIRLEMAPV